MHIAFCVHKQNNDAPETDRIALILRVLRRFVPLYIKLECIVMMTEIRTMRCNEIGKLSKNSREGEMEIEREIERERDRERERER